MPLMASQMYGVLHALLTVIDSYLSCPPNTSVSQPNPTPRPHNEPFDDGDFHVMQICYNITPTYRVDFLLISSKSLNLCMETTWRSQ